MGHFYVYDIRNVKSKVYIITVDLKRKEDYLFFSLRKKKLKGGESDTDISFF